MKTIPRLLRIFQLLLPLFPFPQFSPSESHSILFYNAVATKSMRLSQWPLIEALAERGHNVTYLSGLEDFEAPVGSSPSKTKIKTHVPKKWMESSKEWVETTDFYGMRQSSGWGPTELLGWLSFLDLGNVACQALLTDPDFLEWTQSNKFDLVVIEGIFDECGYALVHLWKAKLVQYSTCTPLPFQIDKFGLADETSSLPDNLVPGFLQTVTPSQGPNFLQRVKNAITPIVFAIWREHYYLPKMERIIKEGLGQRGTDLPSLLEIERNTSLVLTTTHVSMDYPRSLPPHIIPVGGNVVSKKQKPLPKEIEDFIEGGDSGFIYISFGTVVDFASFPEEVQREFIKALESFPEIRFVWKAHSKITAGKLPKNVLEVKWVPQQTILSHPKIKSFITHCGMGSTVESIHFGVPLILIPVGPEQEYNSGVVASHGAGIKVEILDMKREHLENAIREILYNEKYRNGMKKLSQISKDRQVPPVENGVWWIEYVLRHDHDIHEFLVPPSVHQPWWVRRQIDVWVGIAATVLVLTGAVLLVMLWILRKMIRSLFGDKEQTRPNSKLKKN